MAAITSKISFHYFSQIHFIHMVETAHRLHQHIIDPKHDHY